MDRATLRAVANSDEGLANRAEGANYVVAGKTHLFWDASCPGLNPGVLNTRWDRAFLHMHVSRHRSELVTC